MQLCGTMDTPIHWCTIYKRACMTCVGIYLILMWCSFMWVLIYISVSKWYYFYMIINASMHCWYESFLWYLMHVVVFQVSLWLNWPILHFRSRLRTILTSFVLSLKVWAIIFVYHFVCTHIFATIIIVLACMSILNPCFVQAMLQKWRTNISFHQPTMPSSARGSIFPPLPIIINRYSTLTHYSLQRNIADRPYYDHGPESQPTDTSLLVNVVDSSTCAIAEWNLALW